MHHTDSEDRWVSGDQFDFGLVENEFLAYLGLLLAHGVLCAKTEPLDALWYQGYDHDIFWYAMARNHFWSIMHYIQFLTKPVEHKGDRQTSSVR